MTLKFYRNAQVHKVNYDPKISTFYGPQQQKFWTYKNLDFRFFRFFAKMAAKTTSGSGFNHKFQLCAPGYLMRNAFLDVYLQE